MITLEYNNYKQLAYLNTTCISYIQYM